jgi:hypothetical protein
VKDIYNSELFFNHKLLIMKNLFFYTLLLSIGLIFYSGCKQIDTSIEDKSLSEPNPNYNYFKVSDLDALDFINKVQLRDTTTTDPLVLLDDSSDSENDKINDICFVFAKGLQAVSSNSTHYSHIYNAVTTNDGAENIVTLVANNSSFRTALESEMLSVINSNSLTYLTNNQQFGVGLTAHLASQMDRNNVAYSPILAYNDYAGTRALSPNKIFCVAEEITSGTDDGILGFMTGNNSTLVIYENDARGTPDDIYVVQPGRMITHTTTINTPDTPNVVFRSGDVTFVSDELKIKAGHHYDRNASDLVGYYVYHDFATFAGGATWAANGTVNLKYLSVSRNNVQNSFLFTKDHLISESMTSFEFNNFYYLWTFTYEHDWYIFDHEFIANPDYPLSLAQKVRMKYINEWYYNETVVAKNEFPNVNDTYVIDNTKCYFKLKRTR